jgi:arginyl-tRNA synthetase
MPDPIQTLTARFRDALRAAFGEEHASADPAIRRSERADYQADVAMSLSRKLKRPPREVAQALLEHLSLVDVCEKVELAGAGFLNLTLSPAFLARELAAAMGDARLGVATAAKEKVILDYSSPNIAKEMHVGHLRSTIIGDALARVLAFEGHDVVRQNHLGDWGTQFGMLIEHLLDGGAEQASGQTVADLDAFYREARAKFDGDAAFADRARRRVVLLQGGDPATLGEWRRLVDQSKRYLGSVYARLGVTLEEADVRGESFFNSRLDAVVDDLRARGLLVESDGALCVFPPGFTNKEGAPLPLIVRKNDGGYGYAASDLAAIRYRVGTLGGTRLLYVVGAPQQQHLAMVFAVAKQAGWLPDGVRAEHVAFGSVLGADKKMFKTRAGGTVRLVDLIDEAEQLAGQVIAEKNAELDEPTRREVAHQVGVGALKYADLSSDRVKDYVFDWKRMLAFEGNTAPYLQYAHARIRSIFRKAEAKDPIGVRAEELLLGAPEERALALELLSLAGAVAAVDEWLQPHRMCTYLFSLASRFTSFYEACPVLRADDEPTRRSRLALCYLTARTLAQGLSLLGIDAPDRM